MLSGNSLRQTVHIHCASVHQAAKLIAALLRVVGVPAGLAESNGSLPPGLWLTSPAGWLPRTGIRSGTLRSVIEYGLHFYRTSSRTLDSGRLQWLPAMTECSQWCARKRGEQRAAPVSVTDILYSFHRILRWFYVCKFYFVLPVGVINNNKEKFCVFKTFSGNVFVYNHTSMYSSTGYLILTCTRIGRY